MITVRKDDAGRTVVTKCFQAVCRTNRTWKGLVTVYYWYGRDLEPRMADVDASIETILSESHKKPNQVGFEAYG